MATLPLLVGLIGLIGCGSPSATPAPLPEVEQRVESTGWAAELASVDRRIDALRARLAKRSDQWLLEAELASHFTQRARLTGNYDDFTRATAAMDRAFAVAPEGSGPFLGRASLNLTLHRLDRVEADLDRAGKKVLLSDPERARIAITRARLHTERGDFVRAGTLLDEVRAYDDSYRLHAALANLAWKSGDIDVAELEFSAAEERYHGTDHEPRAWIHLMRGLIDLDAERLPEALAHYDAADAALPGYWLIQEHQAEIFARTGHPERAVAIYRPVIAQTESPELMGALAGVLAELGQAEEAQQWVDRARSGFEARLKDHPEAAGGHALDFFLEYGPAERALELAEANAALRPNPEALDQLAQAQALNAAR